MMNMCYDSMLKSGNILQTIKILDTLYSPTVSSQQRYTSSTAEAKTVVKDNELHLAIDLPGVKLADLSVQIEGRGIKITGKRKGEEFKHTYALSKEYDPETTSALLEDGVLTLMFTKTASMTSRKIEIKTR